MEITKIGKDWYKATYRIGKALCIGFGMNHSTALASCVRDIIVVSNLKLMNNPQTRMTRFIKNSPITSVIKGRNYLKQV